VINFINFCNSFFIPIALSYIIRSELILDNITFGFEKSITRGCGKTSVNISINKPKQNRPIGRPKGRQKGNIKIILKETVCDVNWIKLTSDNVTSNVTEKLNTTSSY